MVGFGVWGVREYREEGSVMIPDGCLLYSVCALAVFVL